MTIQYPKWLERMPAGEEKDRAINRFTLRLCCLYAHPHGKIHNLAKLLGMNQNTLKTQIQSDRVVASDETKAAIRKKLGPEFVPPYLHNIPTDRRCKN